MTDGTAKLLAVGDRHEGDAALEPGLASPGLWETPEHKPAPAAESDTEDIERRMKLLGYM